MRDRKAAAVIATCVALLSTGCDPSQQPPPREYVANRDSPPRTEVPTRDQLPEVAPKLGPAPRDCPGPYARPRKVAAAYGFLVGGTPLWAGMYAPHERSDRAYRAADAPRTRFGFRVKVLWVMRPASDATVTISGRNLSTDAPLRFEVEELGDEGSGTEVRLDPHLGGTGESGWKEFPSYVFFDRAGCFELRAASTDGAWRIRFGFGR